MNETKLAGGARMKENEEWKNKRNEEGGITMTIEKALKISLEEYARLSDECNGFNDEVYKNHPVQREDEGIGVFLKKGSCRLMKSPTTKEKLGDINCD